MILTSIEAIIALLFVLFGSLFLIRSFANHSPLRAFAGFFKNRLAKLFR